MLRREHLYADYDVISTPDRLGDVIALLDRNFEALHLCNVVAGDMVFTKNGYSMLQPWILMRRADMEAYFLTDHQAVRTAYFRRLPPPPSPKG